MMPFSPTPGSSSALARIIFTDVLLSSGRLDRANCVAASTGGPPKPAGGPAGRAPAPPGGGAPGNGASGPPGCPSVFPGRAPDEENAPPCTPHVLPESARAANGFPAPGGGAGNCSGAISKAAGDMKITPFTPTPFGPYNSGRPMYVPSGLLPAECAQINMRSGLPWYFPMFASTHWIMLEMSFAP